MNLIYGDFSQDGLEYIVRTPHTPFRDWFNFFWNSTYMACAGQNMNGFSLYQNEAGVVTNLFGKQDMREDPRWIYVRDNATGEFWSAGYLPCWTEHEEFACRHGLGYSVLSTLKNGVRIEFRVFVPRVESGEIWTVRVVNESGRARDLSLFVAANVMLDGVNMPYGYFGGLSAAYEPEERFLFFKNTTHTVVNEKYRAFLYCDATPQHWDVSRDCFLGKRRDYARPERVEQGRLGDSYASYEHLVGALQHDFKLEPGAAREINYVLGIVRDIEEARRMRDAFESSEKIEREFEAMKRQNIGRLGELSIKTPEADFDMLINTWLKHQLYLMADWARFYFKGYRDTCQDSAGVSLLDAPRAFEMLKKALRNQRSDGFCPRAFRVASMDAAGADKHYADSPSWISHATDALIRETGNLDLLDEVVAYSDQGEATVWGHNLQAVEFLWNDRGSHGLSLIHCGDWNDLIDKAGVEGRGESVWMSFALARTLKVVGQLAAWRGDRETEKLCVERHRILSAAIREHGWDGEYFIYAINDAGERIGSHECKEGSVFLNPQSWALLSGVVDAAEYRCIAERVEPVLETKVGPVHHWPPFTKYDPGIGQLSGTPAGYCTNGNVYCHAAAFKIAADFDAGRNDKAFDTLCKILPAASKSEPYAQANGYVGPTAQRMTRHVSDDPWRSGTVAWDLLNVIDRLFGIERTLEGFELNPKLPSSWSEAHISRPFRGIVYDIQIRRGSCPRIEVEGKPIKDRLIRAGSGKPRVSVVCEIAVEPEEAEGSKAESKAAGQPAPFAVLS
ncbi:MAG: GH36-type glycosyl hydrolase domain-containing protein [Chthoniobacteraceae bacterium]